MARCTLLCDIGNTNVKLGLSLQGQGLTQTFNLPTNPAETADSLGLALSGLCRQAGVEPGDVGACVACSVAPFLDPLLHRACRRFFGCDVLFVQRELPVPLENRYERPMEVGADRLVTAYAARKLAARDADALICIDFGTATTFDCVFKEAYLGGLICPGVLSSASALFSRTAKLPQIRLEIDSETLQIGKSTSQSLNQGLIFGFAALAEGVCQRLKDALRQQWGAQGDIPVVATGGLAATVAKVCSCFDTVHLELLMEGLRLLYEVEHKKG